MGSRKLCQDISIAGKRAGIYGKKSSLWFEMYKAIKELRPRFVIIENVGRIIREGLNVILANLAEIRYNAEWQMIKASDVGALHERKRIWIIAYPCVEKIKPKSGLFFDLNLLGTLGYYDQESKSLKKSIKALYGENTISLTILPKSGILYNGTIYGQLAWIKNKQVKRLWFTPSIVQIEPTEGRREKRKVYRESIGRHDVPGCLAEQVKTKKMWPTPRSQEGGAYKDKQGNPKCSGLKVAVKRWPTPTGLDTVENRDLEKQKKRHSLCLVDQVRISPEVKVELFPTPTANLAGEGEFLNKLKTKDGEKAKPRERAYNPKTNKHVQITLNRSVKMFPTPTTQEIEHKDMELTKSGRRKSKKGKTSHSVGLADTVKFFQSVKIKREKGHKKLWRTPDTCAGGAMNQKHLDKTVENLEKGISPHTLRLQDQIKDERLHPKGLENGTNK